MATLTQAVCLVLLVGLVSAIPKWYSDQRRAFIREERDRRTGGLLTLTHKEMLVNHFLSLMKFSAINNAIYTNTPYIAGGHFFTVKERIEASTIYDVIKKMPKGGVLHVHNHAMVSLDWFVKNLTYSETLYTTTDRTLPRSFQFAETSPGADWELLSAERGRANDTDDFDHMLALELSIYRADPHRAYPSLNDVWGDLNNYFYSMGGFWDNDDLNEKYFRRALQEFYDDGVQYIEIRSSPHESYVELMNDLVEEFQEEHPDFIGIKHIFAKTRTKTREGMETAMDDTIALMKKYPNLVKGFDMVSQEDVTNTQKHFLDQLLDEDNLGFGLPYFFHAGETDWTQIADQNLVDAVLLNTSRIGHGFALLRHPKVMERVRKREIAVELNPISNQVLGLVGDLRNHPGAIHLANGDPVVVSSDDPCVWLASPLSHDFYMAYMALGALNDDLKLFKQLILNSFEYSAMNETEKVLAVAAWRPRWEHFIDEIIEDYHLLDFTWRSSKDV